MILMAEDYRGCHRYQSDLESVHNSFAFLLFMTSRWMDYVLSLLGCRVPYLVPSYPLIASMNKQP